MAATTGARASLRLLIDTRCNKVLFAEATKGFVDFLCSLLSLPMATVITIVSKQGMVGCLGDLYESLENLSEPYLQIAAAKNALLKPQVHTSGAALHLLLPQIQTLKCTCLFGCGTVCVGTGYDKSSHSLPCSYHVTNDPTAICPRSGNRMDRQLTFIDPPNKNSGALEQGYVTGGVAKYMIMDNLEVRPMSSISGITTMLNEFNVKDLGVLEEKVVAVGMDEGVELLKMSLQSKTVLTELFLGKKPSIGDVY
ncbi:hypothetical protein SLA2020_247680 [Shorea laevis]